ncbi:type IV secretory system conjugative DNA transfer family protein [Comamonas testosteroni]|uniref:type IV secretory system conjugative DNA transfer family protein n=1 Tax=Comamonas testosteroni TaxID=285 RepID=UPI002E117B84|nr:type IV secretory system conjugative DNA transfer family protein [Comamonas testosteroni]WQD45936.1 type IV secretory system conjugative DNA transfer family protein [Comamonas testosteroni]
MQNVYNLPNAPRSMGGLQWQALFIGLAILFCANIAATQYMAYGFRYQEALGYPATTVSGHGLYAPYMWVVWFLKFNQVQNAEAKHVLWMGLTIAAGGAGVSVLTAALVMFLRTRKLQKGNEHLHGSARWAQRKDIEEMGLMGKGEGVYVGGWLDKKTQNIHYLRHNGPEHILAFAPSRSGKGVGLVLPTLLSWPHSCVVYDIKGENYALTAGWRQKDAGNKVFKFSPVEMGVGAQFNPLSEIRLGTPRDVSDAQNIAHMLTHPKGDSDDEDHWVESATSLLTGVILFACYAALKEGRIASLPEVAQVLTKPGQSFTETLNEMLLTPLDDDYSYDWRTVSGKQTGVHPVVAEKAQEMLDKEEKELSGILSSAKVKLQLYSDPIVSANIRRSDFTVDDLVNSDSPASLYIVVPPSDKDRLKPLTRLMLTLIVNRLTETMKFEQGRSVQTNKNRLLMLIDEFPTLGRMDAIVNAMGYTAGYGIKYYLIVQDKVQLNNVYGENELVFSGTHLRIAYAPNNPETAELLSRMTGTMTVVKAAFNYSGNRLSPMLGQVSTNVEEIERPLMTPDECGRLPGPKKDAGGNITEAGDMLIFATGFPPIYGKQILYFNDPVFSARAKIPAPTASATPFVQKRVTVKAPSAEGQGGAPSTERELAPELAEQTAELVDYPQATPDVAAEDEEAIMRHRQEHIDATDDDAPPDELADYPDEPEEDAPEGRSLRKDADEMPPHPAVPYVKRAPRDTEAVEEVINPDMRPIEPAQVKPPRSRNV